MKIAFPARFVDSNHAAVMSEVEAELEDGRVMVAIRTTFHGLIFEMTKVNSDGTLVYHQKPMVFTRKP